MSRLHISILLLFCSTVFTIQAQVNGGTIDKLRDMYNLDKFEDCLYKADKYTFSEKYRRNPEPYLYVSMCFFKVSQTDPEELDSEYKDPLSDALKYALKYKMKDRKKELYYQNIEFIDDLKMAAVIRANSFTSIGNFRSASSTLNSLNRIDDNNPAIELYKGISDVKNRNTSGNRLIKKALDTLRIRVSNNSDYLSEIDDASVEAMVRGTSFFVDYLEEKEMSDSVKTIISLIKKVLPENEEIASKYNSINGIEDDKPDSKNGFEIVYSKTTSDKSLLKTKVDSLSNDSIQPSNIPQKKDSLNIELPSDTLKNDQLPN